jgi:hypothetical protein
MFGPYPVRYLGFDIWRLFIGVSWWGDPHTEHVDDTETKIVYITNKKKEGD